MYTHYDDKMDKARNWNEKIIDIFGMDRMNGFLVWVVRLD